MLKSNSRKGSEQGSVNRNYSKNLGKGLNKGAKKKSKVGDKTRGGSGGIRFKLSINSGQRSTREVKIGRLSQVKIASQIQGVASTGGIGDTGSNAILKGRESDRKAHKGSLGTTPNSGSHKMDLRFSKNLKMNPINFVGNANKNKMSVQENDRLMGYLK